MRLIHVTPQVEPDHDPRDNNLEDILYPANPSPGSHHLHHHNPWATEAPDPAEGDIDEIIHDSRPDGAVHSFRITYRSSTPRGGGSGQPPTESNPIMADFQRMVQGFLGPQLNELAQERQNARGPLGQNDMQGGRRLGSGLTAMPEDGPTTPDHIFTHHIHGHLSPRDARSAQPLANPVGDIPGYVSIEKYVILDPLTDMFYLSACYNCSFKV